jgi:hypothetical protein
METLQGNGVPFLVGGAYAFTPFTGIPRSTKDFDLFVAKTDIGRALEVLDAADFRTELTFPHWLGKAWRHEDHVDLVFSSGNGICTVDDGWFDHAVETQVIGIPVKIVPCEELLWQKAFVMERERFDGADIMHLLRTRGPMLDWDRLLARFDANWPLLYTYLLFFHFVYPSEIQSVPASVLEELARRMAELRASGQTERVCRGTLVSRAQYLLDIGQYGYADARLAPRGGMSPEDAIFWTWAIDHVP